MASKTNKSGKSKQKMTARQREERIQAAREREEREQAKQLAKDRAKRIGIVVVCVILVLALGLPTVGLALLSA